MTEPTDPFLRAASTAFLRLEHLLYAALGGLLALVAIAALAHAAVDAFTGIANWTSGSAIFAVIDQLLFVLMLVEILHTVRASLRSGTLNAEPFLIVGLIASIRRVLVITLESSNTAKEHLLTDPQVGFRNSMAELIVLSVLIITMVVSIFMIRRSMTWRAAAEGAASAEA